MSEPDNEDLVRVKAALTQLGEHFDSVQVFVTRHEAGVEDGTMHIGIGAGNFFTRYGQVQQWLIANDQNGREFVKRQGRAE